MSQRRVRSAWVATLLASASPFAAAQAADELAAYVGGAIGQSQIAVDSLNVSAHDTGWKALVGVRSPGGFGADAEYVDLGRPHGSAAAGRVDMRASGPAVFGLVYLPVPVPHLDLFGKAGLANIQQNATVTLNSGGSACAPGIGCDGFNRSESEFAWGAGAEFNAGALGVRIEFEQFRASGGSLNFGSVGVLWKFL